MTAEEMNGLVKPTDHLYLLFRYGHKSIPDLRYVTDRDEVKESLAEMWFGKGIKQDKHVVDGLVDHFTCPTNWWCGVMIKPIEGSLDGAIGAIQLRRK